MGYIQNLDEIFRQFKHPPFSVKFYNGEERHYGPPGPDIFKLALADQKTAHRILAEGSIGFGESYMQGSLKIEGDLGAYLRLRHQIKKRGYSLSFSLSAIWARLTSPGRRDSQISQHYDLGNDFFQLVLDQETMSYSAGFFETGSESLAQAQSKKLERICLSLRLAGGARVLDLGCGWGAFPQYAAKKYGWRVTGFTLSRAQLEYCQQLAKNNSLANKLSFEFHDMLKNLPASQWDGIVMIESIEHAGKQNLPRLFENLKNSLKPEAPLVIQSTVRETISNIDRWTLKYIFPGGYLPTKAELVRLSSSAGLAVEEAADETQNYIQTVAEWIKNFELNRTLIQKKYGSPFYRMWKLWLCGTKASFEVSAIKSVRLHLRRPAS